MTIDSSNLITTDEFTSASRGRQLVIARHSALKQAHKPLARPPTESNWYWQKQAVLNPGTPGPHSLPTLLSCCCCYQIFKVLKLLCFSTDRN